MEKIVLTGHTFEVFDVEFSPDGRYIATASADGDVIIWDPVSGKQLLTFSGHKGWAINVEFTPDGKGLASSGGSDKMVRFWDWGSFDQ